MKLLRKIKNGDKLTKPRGRGEVSVYFDTVTYIYPKPRYSVKQFKAEALEAFGHGLKINGVYPTYILERI